MYKIILASKSPRRKELMEQIGLEFEVIASGRDEIITSNIPEEVVKELSLQKAYEVEGTLLKETSGDIYGYYKEKGYEGVIIIGSDTVVSMNGEIMGKPVDKEDAFNMLKKLQGYNHVVSTGIAMFIFTEDDKQILNFAEDTDVYMYAISDEEILSYIETGEPMDKAGSYGIQGIGAKFISGIHGDYNNVVGLPISSIYQTIKQIGQSEE